MNIYEVTISPYSIDCVSFANDTTIETIKNNKLNNPGPINKAKSWFNCNDLNLSEL